MNFDEVVDRHGTHCVKWDMMEQLYGVPEADGLAMWVADMDFKAPDCVQKAIKAQLDHGIYGYFGDEGPYRAAIQWWMKERHGWDIDPSWIFTTHGLVNGTALCIDAFTREGDGVVLFTPVYHAFARVINASSRQVVECELVNNNGRYEFDFDAYDKQMLGNERMLILCSPHNPGGRVWTRQELEEVVAFAARHDLVIVSDEIHQDLTMPGIKHIPTALVAHTRERLVTMTATTKTFNIAGSHSGNVIIEDPDLRDRFARRIAALGISANSFGLFMATAAYSPEGAAWVDALRDYLDANRRLFDEGVNAIPGVKSMAMESTYLAWVNFEDTGLSVQEVQQRVEKDAKIAANHGITFGKGGETYLRFNFATPRVRVEEAVKRLQAAFGDLQ